MPLTNAYATLDNFREHMGDANVRLSQTMLERALNAASRAVDNYTGRRFWQDAAPTARLFHPLAGSAELWVDDISTATGLAIATDDGSGNYATTWAADSYRLWPYQANTPGSPYQAWWKIESVGNIMRFDISTARGLLPVQVTARWGWAAVPPEIEQATLLKAARLYVRKDAPLGVAQFGEIAAVRVTRMDADVVELLSPFRRDVAMVG